MDFFLFVLLNAVLFIRPAEIVPDLATVPIYYIVIVACMVVSLPSLLAQLSPASLASRPVSLCVVGLLVAVPASQIFGKFYLTGAKDAALEFSKNVIYYMLLVATLRTPERLRSFVGWLCVLFAAVSLIAVLQFHEIIHVPGMHVIEDSRYDQQTGERIVTMRLQGTGIYGDPNDLSMLAVLGMILTSFACATPRWRWLLPASLAALALLFYTLVLTASRGGFLAFLVAGCVLLQSRYGWKRAMPLVLLAAAALPLAIGGRQADLGGAMANDTGQSRIQLWHSGLIAFRQAPLFGIGSGTYEDVAGQVAHNSFIHAYTELGMLGGTLFLAAFVYPIWALYRLGDKRRVAIHQPVLALLRPFLLAGIAGYAASMMSLSRNYVVPTFMVLGLGTSYLRLVQPFAPLPELRLSRPLTIRMSVISVMFVICALVFVRVFVNYG